ncbi:MAG: hypothetical protein N2971_04175 [Chlorobi bacterium]|nr:hypothetical protein [Chlorobiota bacterium]
MIWFAATAARLVITYDLFEPGTSELRQASIEHRLDQLRLAENMATVAWTSYTIAMVATIAAVLVWRSALRQHGYMVITALLMMLSLVWQLWIIPSELALAAEFPSRWLPPPLHRYDTIMAIISRRFFQQSPADFLSLLTAGTVVTVLVIQPRRLEHA